MDKIIAIYLLKDVVYDSTDYYISARLYIDSIYDANAKRFVGNQYDHSDNEFYGEGIIYLNSFDTSKLGVQCGVCVCTSNHGGAFYGSVPTVFLYNVVESLPPKPSAFEIETPIK